MNRKFVNIKHYLYLPIDFVVIFGFLMLSFVSAYGFTNFVNNIVPILIYTGANALITVTVLALFKIYTYLTSDFDLFSAIYIALIVFIVQLAGFIVVVFVPYLPSFRDYIFTWMLCVVSLVFIIPSIRLIVRLVIVFKNMSKRTNLRRTLIVGAGAQAKIVIDDSRRNKDSKNKIIALIDDNPKKFGTKFANYPVFGPISKIKDVVLRYDIEEVIIAIASFTQADVHNVASYLEDLNVRIRRMPRLDEMNGPNDKRVIDVDLDELLCRPPVKLDNSELKAMLSGKTVMVTGAGGSIGSELVRQIFAVHPKNLVLFDIYENGVYELQMDLVRMIREQNIKDINLYVLIGSTYDATRVEQVIKEYKPDYIYHAAAYKHVPLMEDSPAEAIRTNVIGTYNVAKFADKYNVKKMILVSTDKAVRPTNTMGATKRFAETIVQYFEEHSKNTKYAAVRFGNVLCSNGSVVPLFKMQIAHGGPVTLTHEEINRFFMTIPEAVSLILQCGLFAEGGEIFILDMGNPVLIKTLAEKLIRQSGYIPYKDINIQIIGLRPGEKLYEEILLDKSTQIKTKNEKIYIEKPEAIKPIEKEIKEISKVFGLNETKDDVKSLLAKIIDTYQYDKNQKHIYEINK